MTRQFVVSVLWFVLCTCAQGQSGSCYTGFEVSPSCLRQRGLEERVAAYQRKIAEAMFKLGASYKVELRIVNNPMEAGYEANVGDVFTEVVRDEEMRNASFVINVTADFVEKQPEILFEASSLHEICHIVNDDLTGYHRNFANAESAEERCVLEAVGELRYRQYLQAYTAYQHWEDLMQGSFLEKVKEVRLLPAPRERDEADAAAEEYFRTHDDGKEHLLVYNGELEEVTLSSTRNRVWHSPGKLAALIKAGRPLIFFHNHPDEEERAAMFPSYEDFGSAALFTFLVDRENPKLRVQFRVMKLGGETSSVAYGFKRAAVEEIESLAKEYRDATSQKLSVGEIEQRQELLDLRLARDSFSDYLQHACPVDLARKDGEVCRTHPQYFLWPSQRFFIHYRPE